MLILNPLNEYSSAFPILECVHIVGIVCGVGTAALVNCRLLGIGLTQNSAARLWSDAFRRRRCEDRRDRRAGA